MGSPSAGEDARARDLVADAEVERRRAARIGRHPLEVGAGAGQVQAQRQPGLGGAHRRAGVGGGGPRAPRRSTPARPRCRPRAIAASPRSERARRSGGVARAAISSRPFPASSSPRLIRIRPASSWSSGSEEGGADRMAASGPHQLGRRARQEVGRGASTVACARPAPPAPRRGRGRSASPCSVARMAATCAASEVSSGRGGRAPHLGQHPGGLAQRAHRVAGQAGPGADGGAGGGLALAPGADVQEDEGGGGGAGQEHGRKEDPAVAPVERRRSAPAARGAGSGPPARTLR